MIMANEQRNERLATEAKAIIALVLRNGPIEELHAGKLCPTCRPAGQHRYSRISDDEMKIIMQNAVRCLYRLLQLREQNRAQYDNEIALGAMYSYKWDNPAAEQ